MKMQSLLPILAALSSFLAGCGSSEPAPDAFGHFESNPVSVSSERTGILVAYSIREGDWVDQGQIVGLIDTTMLALQRTQIRSKIDAAKSRSAIIHAQELLIQEQISTLDLELERFGNLLLRGAVTSKQVDDLSALRRLAVRQLQLQGSQKKALDAEIASMLTELQSVDDQVRRSTLRNPISGTVLQSFAERHEMTVAGKALYSIASLDTLDLRVFVAGDQLSSIQPGMQVEVRYDVADRQEESVYGTISRISSKAEFTPKFLQTKNERTSLVYAVVIRVANNGKLNIGMPAEVYFVQGG